jgi:hypothetical protein
MLLCQGEIASAFGDLLRKLWAPGASPVAPRIFKSKLARFAPQFSGFNQHDSQVSASSPFFVGLTFLDLQGPCSMHPYILYTICICIFLNRNFLLFYWMDFMKI